MIYKPALVATLLLLGLMAWICQHHADDPSSIVATMPVGQLTAAYQVDTAGAAARYQNRRVVLSGVVSQLGGIQGMAPYVVIRDQGGSVDRVWAVCSTSRSGSRDWASLHPGDTIKLQARVDVVQDYRLVVYGCALLKP